MSELTLPKIVASKLLKVIFCEPLSSASTIAIKSACAILDSVPNSFKSNANVTLLSVSPLATVFVSPLPSVKSDNNGKCIVVAPLSAWLSAVHLPINSFFW